MVFSWLYSFHKTSIDNEIDLQNIQTLCLDESLTDNELKQCINLQELGLANCVNITNNGIKPLMNLEKIYLGNNTNITVDCLVDKKIKVIHLGNNNNFDNESIKKLQFLEELGVNNNQKITDELFNNLLNLQVLDLENNTIVVGKYFDKLINLRKLNIKNNYIINSKVLKKIPNLEELLVNNTNYLMNNSDYLQSEKYKLLNNEIISNSDFKEFRQIFTYEKIQNSNQYQNIYNKTFIYQLEKHLFENIKFMLQFDSKIMINNLPNQLILNTIPNINLVNILINDKRTIGLYKNYQCVKRMIKRNYIKQIRKILKRTIIPQKYLDKLLYNSLHNIKIMEYLLRHNHINIDDSLLMDCLKYGKEGQFLLLCKYKLLSKENELEGLCLCCQNNLTLAGEYLLENYFELSNNQDRYCMNLAIQNGNVKLVKLLLNYIFVDYDNYFPLRLAIRYNHYEIIKILLEEEYISLKPIAGMIIDILLDTQNIDIAKLIIKRLPLINYQSNKITALIKQNKLEILEQLYNKLEFTENDVLNLVKQGNESISHFLIKNNYYVKIQSQLLYYAVKNGLVNITKILMKRSINLNSDLIILAAKNGHIDVVNILLYNNKIDPSIKNDKALYEACLNGHIDVVKRFLQDSRVDFTRNHNICLVNAIMNKHVEIAKLLLSKIELNVRERKMFTKLLNKN